MKQPHSILIVDDEKDIREILKETFLQEKFTVFEAKNGKEAIESILLNRPDITLMDVLMPEMDGMTALKLIRQDSWGQKANIIMLTNQDANNEALVSDMIKGKPLHYLIKSNWRIADIAKKVKDILQENEY